MPAQLEERPDYESGLLFTFTRYQKKEIWMRSLQFLRATLLLAMCAPGLLCQDTFKYRVAVNIVIDGEGIKYQASSLINRGLRAIGDVVVVDEKPTYRIDVIGVQLRGAGLAVGYAFAANFQKSYDLAQ